MCKILKYYYITMMQHVSAKARKGAPGTHSQVKQHTNELQNGCIPK
jgi:hypothetical protein